MRSAFTLVELLVSVILFSLIFVFLYSEIDQVRSLREFYAKKENKFTQHERIRSLLFRDLAQADTMTILKEDKDYTVIALKPQRESLYNIAVANVVWLVMKQNRTLTRLESAERIDLPIEPAKLYTVHSDIIANDCTTFKAYESNSSRFASLTCNNESIHVEAPR